MPIKLLDQKIKDDQEEKPKGLLDVFQKGSELKAGVAPKIFIYGDQGTGKSYFGLTIPAKRIFVLSTEPGGTSLLLHHFPDKEVYITELAKPYASAAKDGKGNVIDKPLNIEPKEFLANLEKTLDVLDQCTEFDCVILDSITDLWNKSSEFIGNTGEKGISSKGFTYTKGTEWAAITSAYNSVIHKLTILPCPVVVTAREKIDDLGNALPKAQKETGYHFNTVLHSMKVKEHPNDKTANKLVCELIKFRPQQTPPIEIENITFKKLADAILKVNPNIKFFEKYV